MNLMEAVALRIKQLLAQKNMTQYKLFKKSGVPQSTISTIMSQSAKNCKLDTISQLAQGFDISLKEFFNDKLFELDAILDK